MMSQNKALKRVLLVIQVWPSLTMCKLMPPRVCRIYYDWPVISGLLNEWCNLGLKTKTKLNYQFIKIWESLVKGYNHMWELWREMFMWESHLKGDVHMWESCEGRCPSVRVLWREMSICESLVKGDFVRESCEGRCLWGGVLWREIIICESPL